MRVWTTRAVVLTLALSIWLLPAALFAQATGAEILGTVRDESGAVLPGVTITVRNVDTGVTRSLVSGGDGRYRAPDLAVGNYEISGELQGFRTAVRQGIQLTVGRAAVVDLILTVGQLEESVVVSGDAPLVDVTTSSLGGLVGQEQIKDLPLNGRNFVQLALLETGVAQVRSASTAAVFGGGLKMSVNGGRMEYNNFMMDGTSMNSVNQSAIGGASGQAMGADAIQEFQVLTANFSAEFGRSGGGVINVVTKSGTNRVSGSTSYYNRNDGMDARNYFDTGDLSEFNRHQYGVTLGGPVPHDKMFFFSAYEGLREKLGQTLVGTVPTLAARQGILPTGTIAVDPSVRPYLDLYPVPNGRDFGDGRAEFERTDNMVTEQDFFQARIDHNLSNSSSWFARYTRDFSDRTTPATLGEVEFVDVVESEFMTAEYKRIISPSVLNLLRFGYNRSFVQYDQTYLDSRYNDPSLWFTPDAIADGFIMSASGLTGIGGSSTLPRFRQDNVLQVTNTLTLNPGRHSIKIGGEFQHILTKEEEIFRGRGQYSFTNLPNLLRALPQNFTSVTDDSDFSKRWNQKLGALFFQDDVRVSDDLTLNMGVRWEAVSSPSERDGKSAHVTSPTTDTQTTVGNPLLLIPKNNFAPRAGFAWAPFGSKRTSLRGGVGIFYPMLFRVYWNINRNLAPFVRNVTAEAPSISFPDPFAGVTRVTVTADSFQYNADQPRITQYNLTLQRELLPSTVVTIGYVGSRGVNAPHYIDPNNAIAQVLADGRKFFPVGSVRRNPAWAVFNWKTTDSSSEYNALQLKLAQRFRAGLQFQVSYTLSHSMDDASDHGNGGLANQSQPQDWEFLDGEWGNSAFDMRHLATISVSYLLPDSPRDGLLGKLLSGWQVAGIATLSAGYPFTVTNSFDRDRDASTSAQSRPNLVPGRSDNPILGGPDRYFDPTVFELQQAGFYGNLGRNTLYGPGLSTLDLALVKNTAIGGRVNLQFRAEAFNVLNAANFGHPVSVVFRSADGVPSADAGRITSTATSARQGQLGVRLTF